MGKQYAYHLINNIHEHYQVSTDWEGKCYCGISIKWNDQKTFLTYPCPGISKRHYTGSNTVHQQENNMLLISVNELIMEQPRNSPRQRSQKKTRTNPDITANNRNTLVFCQSDLFDNTGRSGTNFSSTNKWNNWNRKWNLKINWIMCYTSRYYTAVQGQQYVTQITQWCIIFVGITSKDHSSIFLHGRSNRWYLLTKWSNYGHIDHYL